MSLIFGFYGRNRLRISFSLSLESTSIRSLGLNASSWGPYSRLKCIFSMSEKLTSLYSSNSLDIVPFLADILKFNFVGDLGDLGEITFSFFWIGGSSNSRGSMALMVGDYFLVGDCRMVFSMSLLVGYYSGYCVILRSKARFLRASS